MSKNYTNGYIFRFASVMVIIVAAVLSFAAMVLQPFQEKNIRVEKMQAILNAANIETTAKNAEELYAKHIAAELLINKEGELLSVFRNGKFEKGKSRAFQVDMVALGKKMHTKGEPKEYLEFPLFECRNGSHTYYIVPQIGKGLWGPIWGNIAFKEDFNTIEGATFSHKGETPGLGAEIDTDWFEKQFVGKKIFDQNGVFVSVKVVKGGVANSNISPEHGVDAISGGTITSDGLSDMIKDCLVNYVSYFKNVKN